MSRWGAFRFSRTQWAVAATGGAVTTLVIGLPTDVVPNPAFARMTPIVWWDYPVMVATAVLSGLIAGTFVPRPVFGGREAAGAGGGLLSFFAVGCPICNKVVVWLIGTGGALSLFAPLQPYLAFAGMALLLVSLISRVRQLDRCDLTPSHVAPPNLEPRERRESPRRQWTHDESDIARETSPAATNAGS